MTQSEALILTARLFGFFPAGHQQSETAELYAAKLVAYPADAAARAIDGIIDTRREPFVPTWAEILGAIRSETPKPLQIEAPSELITFAEWQARRRA